jgi:hypothetical protein
MSSQEIQKLLGGYATGTLSEAERRALFEAALEDQELFDALAKEQALREVLHDPLARQQLIAALGPAREPWRWLRWRAAMSMAAGVAVLLMVAGLLLRQTHQHTRPVLMGDAIAPRPPASALAGPSAGPLNEMASRQVERKAKRTAPLPAPAGAPAGYSETGASVRGTLQTQQSPVLSVNGAGSAGDLSRAKAAAKIAGEMAARPGVGYALLLKDAGGAYSPVPSGTVFHAGDSVRLQIEPSEAGYVYLFQRNASGWDPLVSQRVEKAQVYTLPSTGGLESDIPAQLQLLLVLSQLEHVDVGALASQAQASSRITLEYR